MRGLPVRACAFVAVARLIDDMGRVAGAAERPDRPFGAPAEVFKRHTRGLHALVLVTALVEFDGTCRLVPAEWDRHLLAAGAGGPVGACG